MKTKEFLIKIADLFLISEESTRDWIKEAALRKAWYFIMIVGGLLGIYALLSPVLAYNFQNYPVITFGLRFLKLSLAVSLLCGFIFLTYRYLRFILEKGNQIKLENIIMFYLFATMLWSIIYFTLFMLNPSYFEYTNSSIIPSQKLSLDYSKNLSANLDFLLFSAFNSIGTEYYKIKFNSAVSSIVGWFQSLYSLALVVLLISSYVSQKMNIKQNK